MRKPARGKGGTLAALFPSAGETRQAIDEAVAWLTAPPVRVTNEGSLAHGAFRRGVDRRSNRPLGIYTEITGYAVSLFVFLHEISRDARHLRIATDAGDFLLRIQEKNGPFPDADDPTDPGAPRRRYAFDTAICASGLARLARATGDRRYAESATLAASWLLGMQRPDGSFFAMRNQDDRLVDPGSFFGDGSCIHAKIAMAFLDVHSANADGRFVDAARRVADQTLTLQRTDGAFRVSPRSAEIFMHAHAYACEGLHVAGYALGDRRYSGAATRGIEWLARTQRSDGGWPLREEAVASPRDRVADLLLRSCPVDAAAQAIRLFALKGASCDAARQSAVRCLMGAQATGGAFHYRKTRLGYYSLLYTWPTQFAVQALSWMLTPARADDLF